MSARRVVSMRIVSEIEGVMPGCGLSFRLAALSVVALLEGALGFRLRREELDVMMGGM